MFYYGHTWPHWFNPLRPKQRGRHLADDSFKRILLNQKRFVFSFKFVPKDPINHKPALSEPMMVYFTDAHVSLDLNNPDDKVHGAYMGPTWGRQDPGGPMLAPWTLLSGKLRTNATCHKEQQGHEATWHNNRMPRMTSQTNISKDHWQSRCTASVTDICLRLGPRKSLWKSVWSSQKC